MIKRVIGYILFLLLILALLLKFSGVNELSLNNSGYRLFINRLAYSFNQYGEIKIPLLTYLRDIYTDTDGILEVLISIADGFVAFINFCASVLNILIRLFTFLYAFVSALLSFKDYVVNA